jgi:tRNA dimethylallyltransferase
MKGPERAGAPPLVAVILGATASGKSELACALSKPLGCEIISADSRQIYRRLDIGTAKPPAKVRARVPHHLLDLIEPTETYDVARYARAARATMREIVGRGRLALVVGGSGFYLRAATGELRLPMIPAAPEVRVRLREMARTLGPGPLHERLAAVDPESAERLHPNDLIRVIRALEVYETTGRPRSSWRMGGSANGEFRFLKIGLRVPREVLYERINRRVEEMISRGWAEEARGLLEAGYPADCPGLKTLGYPEIIGYVRGELGLEEAVVRIQGQTRRYAKRQLTWFRQERDVHWMAADGADTVERAVGLVRQAIDGDAG